VIDHDILLRFGEPRRAFNYHQAKKESWNTKAMLKKSLLAIMIYSAVSAAELNKVKQYPIDANHSTIGFAVSIMDGLSRVNGKFTDFNITLANDENDIRKSSVNVVIKTASINTGIPARDNDLRSADFFDAEKYPEILFQSKRIEKKGKQLFAVGTFTMHGVSKEITLPFQITGVNKDPASKKMNIGYSAHIVLNRRDFGINWSHPKVPNFVGDNVEIEINLITRAIDIQ
jgi:polyisoprenoid-binding protein YceI